MIARLRRNDGYAVPIAVVLMVIMLSFGLASLAFVDAETGSSRVERTHEARLNLTEGVVAAQIFHLSRGWPSTVAKQLPASCTETSSDSLCPQPAQLRGQFSAVDFKLDPSWDVQVRDNDSSVSTGQFYSDATVLNRPTWDQNGDGEMWVRAEGLLADKRRVVVARVRVEKRPLSPPAAPFVAGSFNTGNNSGNKVIVESDTPGVVRCSTTSTSDDCIRFHDGQISPVGSVQSDPDRISALSDGMADALKQMAMNNGTYYATCPSNPSGEVVWVESGNCSYQGNLAVNSGSKKGVFIINNGTLQLSGGVQWWGLIYALNAQGCGTLPGASCINAGSGNNDAVVDVTGTVTVHGGIFIEGMGRLTTGNSGGNGNCANCQPNLVYDPSVAMNITAHGTAGIIQNTWRELLPG
jgi:hypothetical protein